VAGVTVRQLYPRERNPINLEKEAVWVVEKVWAFHRRGTSLSTDRIRNLESLARSPISTLIALPRLLLQFFSSS
jgi:hypothetical protein